MLKFDDSEIFDIQESVNGEYVHPNLDPHPSLIKKIDNLVKIGSESSKYLASVMRSAISPTTYNDFVSGEKIEHWWSVQAVKVNPGAGLRPRKVTEDILKYFCFPSKAGETIQVAFEKYVEAMGQANEVTQKGGQLTEQQKAYVKEVSMTAAVERFKAYEYVPFQYPGDLEHNLYHPSMKTPKALQLMDDKHEELHSMV